MTIEIPAWMPDWAADGPIPYWILSGVVGGVLSLLVMGLLLALWLRWFSR